MRQVYTTFPSEKLEGRALGRPVSRWKDNIKMNLKGIRCQNVDRINVAQDRVRWPTPANMVMSLRFTQGGEFLD
jgi:hypothetical protein